MCTYIIEIWYSVLILNQYITHTNFSINKKDLTELFIIATSQTHFLSYDLFYDQIDGIAMGSPLGLLFMGCHEKNWINYYNGNKPLFYQRYVDDSFCRFENKTDAKLFFDYLNSRHPNIKFFLRQNKTTKCLSSTFLLNRLTNCCHS